MHVPDARSSNRRRVCSEKTTVAAPKKVPLTIGPSPTEGAVWRIGRLLRRLHILSDVPTERWAWDNVATTWTRSTNSPCRARNSNAESLCRVVGRWLESSDPMAVTWG